MKDKEKDALTKKLWGERPEVTNETVKAQKKLVAEQKKLVEDTTKEVNSRQTEVDKLKASLKKYKNDPATKKIAEKVIEMKSNVLLEQKQKLTNATAELKKREAELKSQEAAIKNAQDTLGGLHNIYQGTTGNPELALPNIEDMKDLQGNLDLLNLKHNVADNAKGIEANSIAINNQITNIKHSFELIKENKTAISANKTAISALDKKFTAANVALGGRIDQLATDTDKGLAKASALAALHPLDFDPSSKLNFAVAGGFYNGENAVALGAFYRPNRNVLLSFGSSIAGGENAYNVGLSVKVGKGGDRINQENTTISELYDLVGRLQDQVAAQQKKIEELQAK